MKDFSICITMDCWKFERGGFFKILKKKKKAHIRFSAFYPSHPQIIPAIFLRNLPV